MRNLYVKIGLVVALSFAVSFGLVVAVLPYLEERPHPDQGPWLMDHGMRWAVTELERAGPAGWSAKLAEMQPTFAFPLVVETASAARARLGPDEQLPTKAGTIGPHDGPHLYVPIEGGRWYFVAGPIPHHPRPKASALMVIVPVWLALSIAILSALVIATPISRRLRTLERATRAVAKGDLQVRVDDSSKDVVGQLALSFNAMAARLEQLFRQREQLLQAVSHEISTPLSRIRFHLEALERIACDHAKRERLAALDKELTEVDRISKEMSSWVDADGRRPALGAVAIGPVLHSIVESDRASSDGSKSVELRVEEAGLYARADDRQFHRALENVLRNAVRYARSRVVIDAKSENGHVRIEVRDDGPGIPVGDRTRIFEPFARLDESRSRKEGGMGLGLAITHRIVQAHEGEVWIEDAPEGGAAVVSLWPSAAPEGDEAAVSRA